jgi:CubicO group peptidase (beta-lactamase class C family)
VTANDTSPGAGTSTANAIAAASQVAARVVREGAAPMAAAGWARALGVNVSVGTTGAHVRDAGGSLSTFFDLASVTKPMTAVAVAWAGIDPASPLGQWVPELRGTASEHASLELLLSHRAGLEAHRTLWAPLLTAATPASLEALLEPAKNGTIDVLVALREAANARRPDAVGRPEGEGFAPLYSDLGYLLAGTALARAVGARDAGEAIARIVLEPLGLRDRVGTIRDLRERGITGPFAPTETVAWRGGPVVGAVHDENAWAVSGLGGSGHAGLFGTIDGVLTFGIAVLQDLARDPRRLAWLVRERPGGTLRAGFDGKSLPDAQPPSSAGTRMGPRSFGHLGFTGTSVWIDPDARVVVSLLTNRVCPTRDHLAIRAARPWAHDALFDAALGAGVDANP